MFRTHSPYSPFFTSGLLSSSRPVSPDVPLSPTRRGSLPTDSTSSAGASAVDHPSAFYFTLRDGPDEEHLRSYLSLDLAESQSMRSASLKRKASTAASTRPFVFPPITETPALPLRMRYSRDSLRTIPSPKPAPSITLPEVPKASSSTSTPPRLPSLLPLPALALDLSLPTLARASSSSSSTSTKHAPRTAPSLSRSSKPLLNLNLKNHRASVATTSTVSTRARRHNRSEALARLEGRDAGLRTAPLASFPKRNFMSMSDDEDEEYGHQSQSASVDLDEHADADADDENENDDSDLESLHFPDMFTLHNPLLEPEDMVLPGPPSQPQPLALSIQTLALPLPCPSYLEAPRSAPLPPRKESLPINLRSATLDTDTTLNPTPTLLRRQRTRCGAGGSGSGGSKDWFPLKSFIDLHADDAAAAAAAAAGAGGLATTKPQTTKTRTKQETKNVNVNMSINTSAWMWRSFIEVANVS